MTDPYYYDNDVAAFQVLLEEVTRAKPGSPESRFIQPDGAVVDRLASKFHHVLYGRRGTGKSSLLRYIESDLRKQGKLVAWADQETFKGLSYPDVLVGTLAEIFQQFATQLEERSPKSDRRWFQLHAPKLSNDQILARELRQAVASLTDLKRSPSQSEVEWTESQSAHFEDAIKLSMGATGGVPALNAAFGGDLTHSSGGTQGSAVAHRYTATKSEHLERALTAYRVLMTAVGNVAPDSYVILDDFYHLNEHVQPNIAGYFHRVVKDTGVWLKFGSISLWTRLYAGGSPPIGLQAPHDVRELSLDRGLEAFSGSKRFLEKILVALASECSVDVARLFSDGALDRLVLASGGVPRDYIGLVSESVAAAKNRGISAKSGSERVIAEDVNTAAGKTVETKFSDLREDARGESTELQSLVIELTNHCRNINSACFLINASDVELVNKVNRLQNMRFVHAIASNETLPNQQSDRYHVYVLDVSQLAAQRAWQVDFMGWTKRQGRRARKLVYPPVASAPRAGKDLDDKDPRVDAGEPIAQNDELAVVDQIE